MNVIIKKKKFAAFTFAKIESLFLSKQQKAFQQINFVL